MLATDCEQMKVMIVEDHELIRCGIVSMLGKKPVHVVGEAVNGREAVSLVDELDAEIVLMDIALPIMDGITATRLIKKDHPDVKVMMLSSSKKHEEVLASLTAGADAYCMKDIQADLLYEAMKMVMSGAVWLDPAIAKDVTSALPKNDDRPIKSPSFRSRKKYNTDLTRRESEVLQMLVNGKSNKQIANALSVTIHTVKAHVSNIIDKFAVEDRTQAAVKAVQEGYVAVGLQSRD